jgi:ATP-binding cassette subfamily B protein
MLMPFLWPKGQPDMRFRVAAAMACLVTAKVASVYIPIFYKQAVDVLTDETALAVVLPVGFILAYGAARIMSLGFGELRDAIFAKVAQRAVRRIALSVFGYLHDLGLRFHLDRQTGGLSRSIERGTAAIQTLLRFTLFSVLPTLFEIGLVFIILWNLLDVWFALVTLITVLAYIAYTVVVSEWRSKIRRYMNEQDNRANTRAIDSLLNYETVKYFGNETHEAVRYDVALQDYERAAVRNQTSLSLLNVGQAAIVSIGVTAIMIMAGQGIVIIQGLIDIEKMFDLLSVDREIEDRPDAADLALVGGELRFDNVSFDYDPRRPILADVDFTVPPGRTVAIVGPSGAGKSTISRLLFRFYDVSKGRILIDGQDIRDITQDSLRAAIGIVPQDTVLFNDTVYYNIAYGLPDAGRDDVEQAARLAHIHEFVEGLPDGYDTIVGERGLKLSGGEKQRVAIARTILKGPSILLFDEATSALDTQTEREIQANLHEVSQGRTTLVIAHRLSTVVDADEIVVLDKGRIVERGRHTELLSRRGVYADMWARQQEAGREAEVAGE